MYLYNIIYSIFYISCHFIFYTQVKLNIIINSLLEYRSILYFATLGLGPSLEELFESIKNH